MSNNPLAKLDAAARALAEANTLEEIKQIGNVAKMAITYAKAAKLGLKSVNYASTIRIEALAKEGECLAQLERSEGGRPAKNSSNGGGVSEYGQVLKETETTWAEANRAQKIAELPPETRQEIFAKANKRNEEITVKSVLKEADKRKRKEEKAKRQAEAEQESEWPDWLIVGDFRQVGISIPDNTVDIIFTDPPYNKSAATLYSDLAVFSARVLKPGGICLAYSGQMHLPEIYAGMGQYLEYMWTCAIGHSGPATMFRKWRLNNIWKPLLLYGKPPITAWWDKFFDDYTTGGREKDTHRWQQSENEAVHYIEAMCPANGLVCDPFIGGGTTLVAAKKLGLRYVGFEIDPDSAILAKERIEAS